MASDLPEKTHGFSKSSSDNSKLSASQLSTTPNVQLRPERVAAAIDAIGKLQQEYDKLGERLATLKSGLREMLPDDTKVVEGTAFIARGAEVSVTKLKQSANSHMLLTKMLIDLDQTKASRGGLFDSILALEPEVVNGLFVPLLEAVFEKNGISESDSDLIFLKESKPTLEIAPKP